MSTDKPSALKAESKTALKLKVKAYSISPIMTKQKPEKNKMNSTTPPLCPPPAQKKPSTTENRQTKKNPNHFLLKKYFPVPGVCQLQVSEKRTIEISNTESRMRL